MNAMNSADIILQNGKIITVDKIFSILEAVAIKGDRLVDVGNWEDLKRLNGPQTRVIDLCSRTTIPGIIDSHNHQIGHVASSHFTASRALHTAEGQTDPDHHRESRTAK